MTCWLVTSTFYGQWLPGDERGSVTSVRDVRPGDVVSDVRQEHDQLGQTYEQAIPGLRRAALAQLNGPPVSLSLVQAEELFDQFQETAGHRGWRLVAVAIMSNHVHLVVETPSDVGKSQLLKDLKGYGSRRLNQRFGKRESGTWWTDGGSCRVVQDLSAAIHYVCHRQPHALLIWSLEHGRILPMSDSPT